MTAVGRMQIGEKSGIDTQKEPHCVQIWRLGRPERRLPTRS